MSLSASPSRLLAVGSILTASLAGGCASAGTGASSGSGAVGAVAPSAPVVTRVSSNSSGSASDRQWADSVLRTLSLR
ncbi:MAG: hypothetical protein ACO1Q7_08495, partial [Gemmatimonas sp.]